ncbi:MAG TPA: glycosyltransferase family 2 protein [Candidatus Obscuribacterales bacterium]
MNPNPELSVLVVTSPGRETHLRHCLEMLCRQSLQVFEVRVMDDGSTGGAAVCADFAPRLDLHHHHRPNDRCVSRSLNLGARLARSPNLVILSGDVLLNPVGLEVYSYYLRRFPKWAVYGYLGWHPRFVAPSLWFPEVAVNYLDRRISDYSYQDLVLTEELTRCPHWFAISANTCLHREALELAGGFEERFVNWGQEDLELAYRLLQIGVQIHFSLDAWAEHQVHPRSGEFYTGKRLAQLQMGELEANYPVRMLSSDPLGDRLRQNIFGHYLQHDARVDPAQRAALLDARARLKVNNHAYVDAVRKHHLLPPEAEDAPTNSPSGSG